MEGRVTSLSPVQKLLKGMFLRRGGALSLFEMSSISKPLRIYEVRHAAGGTQSIGPTIASGANAAQHSSRSMEITNDRRGLIGIKLESNLLI